MQSEIVFTGLFVVGTKYNCNYRTTFVNFVLQPYHLWFDAEIFRNFFRQ